MKKIGIITLWSNNYGSVLQCYALKNTLDQFGYKAEILYQESNGIERYKNYMRLLLALVKNGLVHPSYINNFFDMRNSRKKSVGGLAKEASEALSFFVKTQIQPISVPYSEFRSIGNDPMYSMFIAGSDQIWNGSVPYNPIAFLEFAPIKKRATYAPSFGTSSIPSFNRNKFTNSIKKISRLSVREDEGVNIIKRLTGIEAVRLPDPTVLLTKDEWLIFSEKVSRNGEKYILFHFLNEPNDIALKYIEDYIKQNDCKGISFGYEHDCLKMEGIEFEAASPEYYINKIIHAEAIFTDSYHTSLFSARFSKQFYVFDRQYDHKYSQGSRIITLLNHCNIRNRFISQYKVELPTTEYNCNEFFTEERQRALKYLEEILQNEEFFLSKNVPSLKDVNECVGCGNCVITCPMNAVKMKYSEKGFCLPEIDYDKCVKCGKCEQVCNAEIENINIYENRKIYIAFNKDSAQKKESASGGIFSALAKQVINEGGVVFGAALSLSGDTPVVKHCMAQTYEELYMLQKSKYVQSNCYDSFEKVMQNLKLGKLVLFSGTSCQVNALYQYIGGRQYDNLYTVDLICHGVPGGKLFSDYIMYLEKIYKNKIIDFNFRKKSNKGIEYKILATLNNGTKKEINWTDSSYYKMFLRCESYRDACYNCKFASINKPADITIGDYFEAQQDYPKLFDKKGVFEKSEGISCVIVQNNKGLMCFEKYGKQIEIIEADLKKVQNSHNQLCFPSRHTSFRHIFFEMYNKGGFNKVEKYYRRKKIIYALPKIIVNKRKE